MRCFECTWRQSFVFFDAKIRTRTHFLQDCVFCSFGCSFFLRLWVPRGSIFISIWILICEVLWKSLESVVLFVNFRGSSLSGEVSLQLLLVGTCWFFFLFWCNCGSFKQQESKQQSSEIRQADQTRPGAHDRSIITWTIYRLILSR